MKKIAFFSTGIPDPNQGGSGIFNYYLIKRLLEKNNLVDCFFRVNKKFLDNHTNPYLFEKFKKDLNYLHFVNEKKTKNIFSFGRILLEGAHHVSECKNVVFNLKKKYDAYISLDLGWAIALDNFDNCISVLGDPYHARVIHSIRGKNLLPMNYYRKIRALSCISSKTMSSLAPILNNRTFLGSFSKQHAEEYRSKGVNCQTLDWFSPDVGEIFVKKHFFLNNQFNLCHIGDLQTTASRKNIYFLKKSLSILSKNINKKIVITFIGRFKEKITSSYSNIEFRYLGFVENLSLELKKYDALISVSDYPVGTRTRIISALSHGLPCISHFAASFGLHQLKHGHDILFCKNAIEFAENINLLIKDKNLQIKISRNSRLTWLKYFNPTKNVDKILKIVNC
jgi:glycosyltransferase involved in cell wall biosynthesis